MGGGQVCGKDWLLISLLFDDAKTLALKGKGLKMQEILITGTIAFKKNFEVDRWKRIGCKGIAVSGRGGVDIRNGSAIKKAL